MILNKTITKWFARTEETVNGEKVSLKGYGAKYLRRYLGELALDLGQTENWVQQALGHAFDSKSTRRYMRVREGTMLDVCLIRSQKGLSALITEVIGSNGFTLGSLSC